jgi:uncharacterized Ntn-hydrolase superfamily protein
MTFSIAARCASTGMFGVAVSSSSPAVAARCAYARAGVGAVLSQNITDPRLGLRILDVMEQGASAEEAISDICRSSEFIDYRQLIAVDKSGGSFVFSGNNALGKRGEAMGRDVASGGNLLADENIPHVLVDTFLSTNGHLADRLLGAMQAAVNAGGEEGPIHSAGLKIVGEVSWPIVDLRVDWTESCPIAELTKLWQFYEPQLDAYVTRAQNPTDAPSYGVPGDE